jgi:NAD(P)-dependent dehydrogenase (short-subunit alcohol dehydrogenase family)/acyl dehydratase
VTRTLRITHEHLQRFADASGDHNPLHIDESFARATPYGRPICHGALVALAALGAVDRRTLRSIKTVDLQFKQAIFPGEECTVSVHESEAAKWRIDVAGGGRIAAVITVTIDEGGPPLPGPSEQEPRELLVSPRQYSLEELADLSLEEQYSRPPDELAALAADLGAAHVPESVLIWLAAASYTVGMLVPGRDALFVGARIRRSSAPASGVLRVSVSGVDDRTGLVIVEAALDHADVSAHMALQTFLRPTVPAPDPSSIAQFLPPSDDLSGRNILVVGASRGIGAALSGALSMQGATVWAGFARSAEHAERLSADFGPKGLRPVQFNAEDVGDTRRAFETLRADAEMLDAVVFCAAPPLYDRALDLDTVEAALEFLHSSFAMVLIPLTESLRMLSPTGCLVLMSSSAVEDPPEGWPHYVSAKAALEGLAAYCASHSGIRVLIVRAPKTWTDSTNTPLGRISAAPKEQVAAAIARWVMRPRFAGEDAERRPIVLTADELMATPPQVPHAGRPV